MYLILMQFFKHVFWKNVFGRTFSTTDYGDYYKSFENVFYIIFTSLHPPTPK